MLVDRLSDIEIINEIESEFYQRKGISPYNISSWQVDRPFQQIMMQSIDIPIIGNPIDYIYTYSLTSDLKNAVQNKIGNPNVDNFIALFTPNNTVSILNISNFLKQHKYKKVAVLNPAYFSIAKALNIFEVPYETVSLERKNGQYHIPFERIIDGKFDAIWLTSPIYSTGVYFDDNEVEKIQKLINIGKIVISDESFALAGKELVRKLHLNDNFIGIYCPHKSICCNSLKFSVIISSDLYEDFWEQWVDILCGNLPLSSIQAIYHYLSNNFLECESVFNRFIESARDDIMPILLMNSIDIDMCAEGSLMTLYFNNVPFQNSINRNFFLSLMNSTHSTIYPGYLNGFGKQMGFCFRINLALNSISFRQSLQRIITYFADFD